jgi:hypothetical protein
MPSSSLLSRGLTRFLERPVAVATVDEAEGLLLLAVEAVAVLMRGIVCPAVLDLFTILMNLFLKESQETA